MELLRYFWISEILTHPYARHILVAPYMEITILGFAFYSKDSIGFSNMEAALELKVVVMTSFCPLLKFKCVG